MRTWPLHYFRTLNKLLLLYTPAPFTGWAKLEPSCHALPSTAPSVLAVTWSASTRLISWPSCSKAGDKTSRKRLRLFNLIRISWMIRGIWTAANPFQFKGQFQLINCCTIFLNQLVKILSITFFSQTANFIQHQVLDGLKLTNITNQLNSSLSPLIAVAFSTSLIEAIYCLYFASSLGFYQGRASAVAVSCYRNNTFEFRSNRYLLFPI